MTLSRLLPALMLAGATSVHAQITYQWNQAGGNANWSDATKWTQIDPVPPPAVPGPPTTSDSIGGTTGTGDLRVNVTDAQVVDWTFNESAQPGGDWDILAGTSGASFTVTGTFLKQGTSSIRIRSSSLGDFTVDFNVIDHDAGILDFGDRNSSSDDLWGFSANQVTSSGASELRFNMDEAGTGAAISGSLTLEESLDGSAEVMIKNSVLGTGTLEVGSLDSVSSTTAVYANDIQGTVSNPSTVTATLEINKASGTSTFAGRLDDNSTDSATNFSTLSIVKNGAGTQEFSGTNNDYTGTTTVNGGTLLISGQHSQSTQHGMGGDYIVNAGGTLAGTNGDSFGPGQVNITTNNDAGITINSGGMLSMGPAPDEVGIFSADLGGGVMDITGAVGGANTGSLLFDLAAIGASDQFILSGGTLAIGTGELEFADFDFTALAGIQEGDYTLFDTTENINGTLGTQLTGIFGSVWEGTLSIQNDQDVVLSVALIPEPTSAALLLGAVSLLAFRRRIRHSA